MTTTLHSTFGFHGQDLRVNDIVSDGKFIISNKIEPLANAEVHGIDITTTGKLTSSGGVVSENIVLTTSGTAGSWACGLYVKTVQGTTKNVNGYLNAAEFEVTQSGSYNGSDYCILALNSTNNNTGGPVSHPAFMYIREYGTKVTNGLFWFADAAELGGAVTTTLISAGADDTATHKIRCFLPDGTPLYILATTTAPHS